MATGIPCIAADVTAVGEVIRTGETGWLIPCDDTDALSTALLEAAASPELRRLTDAARALIEQEYSSPAQARRLRELVEAGRPVGEAARPAAPVPTTRS